MKIGIIGTGWGARVQVPAFRQAGLEVTAIAGHDRDKTARIASELEVEPFSDWRALVDDSGVDLVSIVTPPALHVEMAIAALERGHHVLCEKPTALDAAEAMQLVEAADRHHDRITLIDHELRFLPAWREAKRTIGEIGDLLWVEARYASPSRRDPERPWNWWSDASQGGGIWGAVGSHLVDTIRHVAADAAEVSAHLDTFIESRPDGEGGRRDVTSDDFASVRLRLEGGAIAEIVASVVAAVDEETSITFHGSRGGLRLSGDRLLVSVDGKWRDETPERDFEPVRGDSPGGPFGSGTVFLGRALHAWEQGERDALSPGATFRDGLAQQQILDAARRSSSDDGRWTAVDRRGR